MDALATICMNEHLWVLLVSSLASSNGHLYVFSTQIQAGLFAYYTLANNNSQDVDQPAKCYNLNFRVEADNKNKRVENKTRQN